MIKILAGHKGSGKTKKMIEMANEKAKTSDGNVVVIEKGVQLTYDLSYHVRLVDVEQYGISCFNCYFGFLCGLMAGNYDITDIFCDATFKVCGKDVEKFGEMVDKLKRVTEANGVTITFVASCELDELTPALKELVINE